MGTNLKIRQILRVIPKRRYYQSAALVAAILAGGLSQALLIASVSPFLQLLAGRLDTGNDALKLFLGTGAEDLPTYEAQLLAGCVIFSGLAISTGLLRLVSAWGNGKLTSSISADLAQRCFSKILHEPYIIHVSRNSSHVIGDLRQIDAFTTGVIAPSIQIVSSGVTIAASAIAALAVSWQATSLALVVVGSIYVLVSWQFKRPLRAIGAEIVTITRSELKAQHESLGAIRDIILDGNQQVYIDSYIKSMRRARELGAKIGFLQVAPRYSIESAGFVVIGIIGWIFASRSGGVSVGLPMLGGLAVAYQSILPSVQQIYSCWTSFRTGRASIDVVWEMSQGYEPPPQVTMNTTKAEENAGAGKIQWSQIVFEDISFAYDGSRDGKMSSRPVLQNINLVIKAGERIGIIGKTGSGKSTTADLLMGLLLPTEGSLIIDGHKLGDEVWPMERWRRSISHVPQHIFLTDASIAENIAFGEDASQIDWSRLEEAASMAQLGDVVDSLPMKWYTPVGERGTRLSGGQRQRIGLARAFYKKASLIILDEATSALDYATEAEIMHSVEHLGNELTVVMIAHRIKTLALCDRILVFRDGHIVDEGSYEQLKKSNAYFRDLARLA